MHAVIACAVCGMDAGTDAMLINTAIAATIGTPWLLRHQLVDGVRRAYRRVRGGALEPSACPLPGDSDEDDPEDR